jgi:protein tyrosine phosphatase (PTP) superfamily phosphohydrolase (DUF442 family)
MNSLTRTAFDDAIASARSLMRGGRHDEACTHLERAHVLGQRHVAAHVLTHWLMLRIAFQRGEPIAVIGQALRIMLGALGSALGIVPTGNTGGTNVSMFKRMPIDPQLADLMQPLAGSARSAVDGVPGSVSAREKRPSRVRRALVFGGTLTVGIVLGALMYAYAPELIRSDSTQPPVNFVAVTERIHTSGQPSAAQLGGLKASGYGLIINLAPPETMGSIADEGKLVASTGISYLNIPVDWHTPRYEDFELFSSVLDQAGARRVLVHCQINKRASVFSFLYRVVHQGIDPDLAYENVTAVWVPDAQWKDFARAVLARHDIAYQLD